MASNRKSDKETSLQDLTRPWTTSLALIVLPAAASSISQMILGPSFGSIPSAIHHKTAILATYLLGLVLYQVLPRWNQQTAAVQLGIWIFWIPIAQSCILPYNDQLGPVTGAIIHGLLSCHTIVVPSALLLATELDALFPRTCTSQKAAVTTLSAVTALLLFRTAEELLSIYLPYLLSTFPTQTPIHLQILLGTLYLLLSTRPSRKLILLLSLPAILYTAAFNPHSTTTRLNTLLSQHNYTLLDRHFSPTAGYLSVLESHTHAHRLLRADHSLLGGEWLLTPSRIQHNGWQSPEPIYSVFLLLEAIRLLNPTPPSPLSALVIGLGIGTTPAALISHGIPTTILDLDPTIHRFASSYFSLPPNHTFIPADALVWVPSQPPHAAKYSYIVHDVFTSGAEPLGLFTESFLSSLKGLLSPIDGVIAINYAGPLHAPLTRTVVRTVWTVFARRCRAFRDSDADNSGREEGKGEEEEDAGGFVNLVMFCRNDGGEGTLSMEFRRPTEADFLGSLNRKRFLYPAVEREVDVQELIRPRRGGEEGLLVEGSEGRWRPQQEESALRHWRIMRGVVQPGIVWDLW